jgi:hypothetical protein
MDALLRSPFGKSLTALKASAVQGVFKPLLNTINPMIAPGTRLVADASEGKAMLVFKEEVIPIQLYVGLLRSLCNAFYRVGLEARWEKPAAERIELYVEWS